MKIILTDDFRYLRDATESDTGFVEVDEIDYHLLKDNMKYYYKDKLSRYFYNIAIGLDQLGGCLLYNQVDWTVSSWTYYQSSKHKEHYYFMKLIDLLFGKDHCYNSFLNETKVHKQGVDNV